MRSGATPPLITIVHLFLRHVFLPHFVPPAERLVESPLLALLARTGLHSHLIPTVVITLLR